MPDPDLYAWRTDDAPVTIPQGRLTLPTFPHAPHAQTWAGIASLAILALLCILVGLTLILV
jgi:hypothetical protein